MKKIIFLLIAVLLIACTPQVIEPLTATSTPHPTQTPIPTPTLHPKFIELQNTINAEDGLALTNDGTIEHNGVEVPDVKVTADGRYVLVVGDEMVMLDPNDVTFGEDGITIDGYTLNENGEWVEAEVRQFAECSFAELKSCPVAVEDTSAKQDYVRSLVTPEMFNLDNLKYTKMNVVELPSGDIIVPDVETAPNYSGANAERAPFIKDNNWNGVTEMDGITHAVVNIPYVVEDGKGGYKVIVMTGFRPMKGGGYDVANIDEFNNRMNIIPWRVDQQSIELATRFVNPATGENFTTEEVTGIIEEMRQGDFARADGLVLYFTIARNSSGWFE